MLARLWWNSFWSSNGTTEEQGIGRVLGKKTKERNVKVNGVAKKVKPNLKNYFEMKIHTN